MRAVVAWVPVHAVLLLICHQTVEFVRIGGGAAIVIIVICVQFPHIGNGVV